MTLNYKIYFQYPGMGTKKTQDVQFLPIWGACTCVFILTEYDRSNFLVDEVSILQIREGLGLS